jgi:hypothetical protein
VATCRSCEAPIVWGKTRAGRAMPLDAEPDPAGNVVLLANGTAVVLTADEAAERRLTFPEEVRRMPHHATCPQADEWRRRRPSDGATPRP